MKKNFIFKLLFGLLILLSFEQCVNNKISKPNIEITVRVVNNKTNEPFSNGSIELQQTKRTLLGFIKVYTVLKTQLDDDGKAIIKIDSLSNYRILITPKGKNIFSCYDEIEKSKINFNEEYEIRCLDDSEKESIR